MHTRSVIWLTLIIDRVFVLHILLSFVIPLWTWDIPRWTWDVTGPTTCGSFFKQPSSLFVTSLLARRLRERRCSRMHTRSVNWLTLLFDRVFVFHILLSFVIPLWTWDIPRWTCD